MLNILWNSDKMTGNSAYSKVTYETCTRLAKLGHNVAHLPMGRANRMSKDNRDGVLVLVSGYDPWNEDVTIGNYVDFKADLYITFKDLWIFQNIFKYAINFTPYVPIDHSPVSPLIISRLTTAFKVLVPTRFAQRELRNNKIENVTYIPHGVRTDLYKPLDDHRAECKKLWFMPEDDFTVLIVALNRARKMIPRMLHGYKLFREQNPDIKTHLMMWTDIRPPSQEFYEGAISLGASDSGVNLLPEIMQLGLGDVIQIPETKSIIEGLPEWSGENYVGGWDMVKLYNACDCLLLCTGGEGFGLPLIEAQACGKPVITTDYAGGPENVGIGYTIPPDDYVNLNTPGTRYALADLDKMAEALTKIAGADKENLSKRARSFAEKYDWNNIIKAYWTPFLDECENELRPLLKKEGATHW